MSNSATIQEMLATAKANISVDFAAASGACTQVIELAKAEDNVSAEADARHLLSQVLFSEGKNIEAIEEIKKTIQLRETLGERAKASASLNNLGIYLTQIADYPSALESCFRALKIKEELNDKKGTVSTLINIGSIYQRLNNTEQEMKMYERALQIAVEMDDQRLKTYIHLNLGLVYTNKKEYEQALQYLDHIDEVFLSYGDKMNAINALNNQGKLFFEMEQYDKALEKYIRGSELSKETGNIPGMANALMNMGEIKMKLNLPAEAKPFIDEAMELSKKHALKINLKDARLVLSEYYTSVNDYKKALEEYRGYVEMKDDLLNIQNLKQLGELHLRYDLDKKEKEAEINHLKNVELREAMDKLQYEKNRSDNLLLNILPEEVAEELKATGTAKAKYFERVSVMFIDIKNFTGISQELSPETLVAEIDFMFRGFDEIIKRFDVEKIKTIGDAYMCAGGIPVPDVNNAENVAGAAIEILGFMERLKQNRMKESKPYFEIRIGINTGPVVAGIVGSSKFAYDIWGDTVNTAARMEQGGEAGKINISGDTYPLLKDKFNCTYRGKINAKNKGEVDMYFLTANKKALMNRILLLLVFCEFSIMVNAQRGIPRIQPGLSLPDASEFSNITPAYTRILPVSQRDCAPEVVNLDSLLPNVGIQGNQNSCVGFALGYACRSYYNAENSTSLKLKNGDNDSSKIISPAFIYNLLNHNNPDEGIYLEDGLRFLMDTGACTWDVMPYNFKRLTKPGKKELKQIEKAQKFKIDTFSMINPLALVEDIKAQLRSKQPVVITAIRGARYFLYGYYREDPSVPYLWDYLDLDSTKGHAILITGYDDHKQAFRFMNSYGEGWGNKGFGWLSYKIVPKAIYEAYVIKPKRKLKPLPKGVCEVQNRQADQIPTEEKAFLKSELQKTIEIFKPDTNDETLAVKEPSPITDFLSKKETRKMRALNRAAEKALRKNQKTKDAQETETEEEENRTNNFKVTMTPLTQTDSNTYDISMSIDISDCKCDSYQVAIHLFIADYFDKDKKGIPVQSYDSQYRLSNDNAAIICEKKAFTCQAYERRRIQIPLNKLALPEAGYKTDEGYQPGKIHLIAEAVWYNDDFPVKCFGTISFDVER